MTIKKELEGQSLCVAVEGRIDAATAPELEKELTSALELISDLTLDLKEVDYVSSSGLRLFVTLQKRMNQQGSLTIRNVRPEIVNILKITGLYNLLNIQ